MGTIDYQLQRQPAVWFILWSLFLVTTSAANEYEVDSQSDCEYDVAAVCESCSLNLPGAADFTAECCKSLNIYTTCKALLDADDHQIPNSLTENGIKYLLGKRSNGDGDSSNGKKEERSPNPFIGKRRHPFLGKRKWSPFLGKRRNPFLGKRNEYSTLADKRRLPFLGK